MNSIRDTIINFFSGASAIECRCNIVAMAPFSSRNAMQQDLFQKRPFQADLACRQADYKSATTSCRITNPAEPFYRQVANPAEQPSAKRRALVYGLPSRQGWVFVMLLLLSSLCTSAQRPAYPQNYFRNPLDIPILLAGNFGECRPGHFHSGLDIKTQGKENFIVRAAADGYISRVKMERGGFGHAIYITHPNGYITLYAHLNDFIPKLQQYLRTEQYKKENWECDLSFTPAQFPVKQGDQIAWSGNTGGSTAPHLHFEIRSSKTEHPLNPQLFGFDIKDTKAPVPTELAVYTDLLNFYDFGPGMYKVKGRGGKYIIEDTILIRSHQFGLGLVVNDFMDGSDNTLAFYTAKLKVDGDEAVQITLDDIGYDRSRYVNAYADYRTKKLDNKWVQCFFKLKGNQLDQIYSIDEKVAITAGIHTVAIELTDASGNSSTIDFIVRRKPAEGYPVTERLLNDGPKATDPYSSESLRFSIPNDALYSWVGLGDEDLKIEPDESVFSSRVKLLSPAIPCHKYFDLFIKPNKPIPFGLQNKIVMMYSDGKDSDGRAAVKGEDGFYKASIRNFGEYWLVADTTAPSLQSVLKSGKENDLSKATQILFKAKDAITSVKKFRVELDGKWLLFEQSGNSYFYKFDGHFPKGIHELSATATDENGNTTKQIFSVKR